MPGSEVLYGNELYPKNPNEHQQLVTWCTQAFIAADSHRANYYDRWLRYYKLYRSFVKRETNDWRSKVFIPHTFATIESIAPRILAQLPTFVCNPMGPEDVQNARSMETLLNYSADQSDLYIELIKTVKSALKYGTGIMKTYHRRDVRVAHQMQPVMQTTTAEMQRPVTDETGTVVLDPDGNPIFQAEEVPIGQEPIGYQTVPYEYVAYDGPAAEDVDIFNFWVAPESEDIQSARYVIQRVFRDVRYIQEQIAKGNYRLPEGFDIGEMSNIEDEPLARRLSAVGLGGDASDPTRKPVELLEFWTDRNEVITFANRKVILRRAANPFNHSEKPYVRMVDYLQEHEFWGVGEVEVIEGLQDLQNAIINQRIDNVRLKMNGMFAIDKDAQVDVRTLRSRPGGIIEVSGVPQQVLQMLDFGDITQSAFTEAAEGERLMEKTTGVTAYQTGTDSPYLNDTATGVALISEQGNTKFSLKLRMLELFTVKPLGRQWGSLIQQFTSGTRVIRLLGPEGQALFMTFDPESIMGGLDYDVQSESSAQTETIRRQQDQMLLQMLAGVWPYAVPQLVMDLLRSFGKKNIADYMMGPQQPDPQGQAQSQQALSEPVQPGAAYTNQQVQGQLSLEV